MGGKKRTKSSAIMGRLVPLRNSKGKSEHRKLKEGVRRAPKETGVELGTVEFSQSPRGEKRTTTKRRKSCFLEGHVENQKRRFQEKEVVKGAQGGVSLGTNN